MGEIIGVLAAVASSTLGGLSVGVTRLVIGSTDPITLGAFRFGIGCLLLLPLAWRDRCRWPPVSALPAIAGLGLLFFAVFPILFNASLIYTTAARGSLALSTLPVLTMLVGALLRMETVTARKTVGVVIASVGVAIALLTDQMEIWLCLQLQEILFGRRSVVLVIQQMMTEIKHIQTGLIRPLSTQVLEGLHCVPTFVFGPLSTLLLQCLFGNLQRLLVELN